MKLRKIFLIPGLIIALGIIGFYIYVNPKYVVPVLTYHHIDEDKEKPSPVVSPQNFRRQMRFLSERNYNVISLAEFAQAKIKKERLSRNTAVITFDDGYEDNYTFAYPILKEYNLPATIFVIVNFIDREGYLTSRQIEEMTSSGLITIGSHGLSETFLPGQNRRELEREIGLSKELLESKFNRRIDFFCYSFGHFNAEIQEVLRKYGYTGACTTNRGKRQTYLNEDLFALKRIKIKDSANLFVLWVKLSGHYNFFRKVRRPE